MSTTLNQKAKQTTMIENIAKQAKLASSALDGWGAVARVGFIGVSALANKIELALEARRENSAKALHLIDMGSIEVAKTTKINPLMWKPQLEQIALLSLRDAGIANSNGERASAKMHFENFAKAIGDAREAGPISERTLSKILDKVDEFRANSSFMHMAMDLKGDLRLKAVEALITAKVNPDFRVSKSDPSALSIATELNDARIKEVLLKAGATYSGAVKLPKDSRVIRSEYVANDFISKLKPNPFKKLAPTPGK